METFEIGLPSPLFPFTREDLPDFRYAGYQLRNVFRSIDDAQRRECTELWVRNGVLSISEARRRSSQVCYLISEINTHSIIGVNTLYLDQLYEEGQPYWFNRMFIQHGSRNSRLMITATAAMLCFAKLNLEGEGAPGVLNVNENPKLGRAGMRRVFSRLGYRWQGRQGERDYWYFDFTRVTINDI